MSIFKKKVRVLFDINYCQCHCFLKCVLTNNIWKAATPYLLVPHLEKPSNAWNIIWYIASDMCTKALLKFKYWQKKILTLEIQSLGDDLHISLKYLNYKFIQFIENETFFSIRLIKKVQVFGFFLFLPLKIESFYILRYSVC